MAQLQFSDKQYLTRSWRMLTREESWIKAVLLLTLYSLIPIVGGMVLVGASFEWARLTAWGVESSPKQKGINFSKCLKTGFFAALAMIVLHAACTFILSLVATVLPFLDDVAWIFIAFIAVIIEVVVLYMTIYDQFSAAFSFNNLWKMISHDPKGLLKIWGEHIKLGLILAIPTVALVLFVFMIILGTVGPDFSYRASMINEAGAWTGSDIEAGFMLLSMMFSTLLPFLVIFWIISSFIAALTSLLTVNMVGLWMLQFRVSEWGNPTDPLPTPMTASDFTTPPTSPTPVSAAPTAAPNNPVAPAAPLTPAPPVTPAVTSATEPSKEAGVSEEFTITEPAPQPENQTVVTPEPALQPAVEQQSVTEEAHQEEQTNVIEKPSVEEEPTKEESSAESLPVNHGAFCPECGSKVSEDSLFCPQCGTKLEN